MTVEKPDAQIEGVANRQDLVQVGMPDAKTGGRTSHIGAVAVTGSQPGIEPDSNFSSRKRPAIRSQLLQGTGIEPDAFGNQ